MLRDFIAWLRGKAWSFTLVTTLIGALAVAACGVKGPLKPPPPPSAPAAGTLPSEPPAAAQQAPEKKP